MRFSCISEPQRNATSLSTSILPSQTTSPPGRTASRVRPKAGALPAASITQSTPRPAVSFFAIATASSLPRIDPERRAHFDGELEFRVVDVDRNDGLRAGKTRALHGGQADRAAADHHDRIGAADARDIERSADAGHDAAADQASAIERHVLATAMAC